ncbi:MAG: hypothetical protein KAW56_11910, partial [Candidatus Marinimicrobia bacterium]|nr:hypothetical protein [Candidatus Neomarinimicrobiota bacterium]
DITKFTDSGMDFNLNDYLLSGVTAKLHFNTGNLGGYEFEVSAYNNSTKEITIIAYKDDQGYEMPNATLKPAVGDKYVLLDIFLPQSYIDTAETALQAKAQAYIDDNSEPRVTYILTPDPRYFKTHLIELEAGDFITIQDTVLGIDVMTRIVELTKSVTDEYKYTLKLTDHLEVQLIQRIYDEQGDLKEKIEIGEGGDIIRSRRNWRTSEELRVMVFDTDGYFDMGNIRPESVSTSMLSVGSKSTQFILSSVEIEGNYTSDVSKFHASAGSLIHLSIADAIRTWTLSSNSQDSLVNETAYYIYAKCTKDPGYTGQVVVDSVQRKFDDDPTYYYFLIGVLHSVVDGVRGVSLTYGQTIINGKFIRTGKIESTDGQVYFDLDNNEIVLNKTSYASETAGIWLGYDVDKYKLNIGDATKYLKWDGATLTIKGLIGDITLDNTGFIKTSGKDSYADTDAGFWLGYDVDKYKLNIGNATKYIKWDGATLTVKGLVSSDSLSTINANIGTITAGIINGAQFRCGGGTDNDFLFEDSSVYMYDFLNGYGAGYKGIALKYSAYQFFDVSYNTSAALNLKGSTGISGIYCSEAGSKTLFRGKHGGYTLNLQLIPAGVNRSFYFYGTGQSGLPNLTSNPTANLVVGQLCSVSGVLKYYNGSAWKTVTVT